MFQPVRAEERAVCFVPPSEFSAFAAKMEARAVVKSYAKAGKSASEAHTLLQQAFPDSCPSLRTIFRWHREYLDGRDSIEDERGRHPKKTLRTPANIDEISSQIIKDRRLTIQELATASGLSYGTTQLIITEDLGLSKISARWVPRLLSDEHKEAHLRFSRDFKNRAFYEGKAFLESIITLDETWVSYSTPEMKYRSMQWLPKGSPAPTKAKTTASAKKVMLTCFFDSKGLIYQHWVPSKQTINAEYFKGVLGKFLEHLRKKRPDLIISGYLLHMDNARPHTARVTQEFLTKKGIKLLDHPPYSPDLSPCDFFLFPELKKNLAGQKFVSDPALKGAVEGILKRVSKNGLFHVFESWVSRCEKCIEIEGGYVEKEQ